ncbi:Transposon Tf2-9 polyprotein [Stylophora pistillata]|uniref:Transposon Tf2-9 polyprotein n=1 Tax=Stylophora pistillata TaxID=50429 RepID=A0A2B4S8V8_STYPI|nr:Transposon Tf2-9 polyprotein [Stylophora pistillata]
MTEGIPFVKPPEPLDISTGNPAFSWGKWKQKFVIYFKATGASKKPDEMKVELVLNHIGESCLEIYSNFVYLPERDDPAGGEDKLPAENPDDYATVLAKLDDYFHKRDPQLMLREKFWLHLTRDSTQTFDSWVVTVNERAAECKFPANFYEQSVRDKLTFSSKEDSYKLKLYDEGTALSLDRPLQILSLKEATKRVTTPSSTSLPLTPTIEPASIHQTSTSDSGWYVKLKVQDQELTWRIDTGAENPGKSIHCQRASKLLLVIPAIRSFGLIHEIPGTCRVNPVEHTRSPDVPPRLDVKENIVKQYPMLFQGLGKLEGEYTIRLKDGVTLFCLTTPRQVPLPLVKKVRLELQRMLQLDVIEPLDEPTDWCSPIVVVPKANGDVRLSVDLTKLNQAVRREVYQMPTVKETLSSLTDGSVFSKLDANSGFHQIVLNSESARLTTVITAPFGRFMFKRLPFGITSVPEYFQKRMDQKLSGIEGVKCRFDDILIMGKYQAQHDERLRKVLDTLVERGLTLNREKFLFSQSRLQYLGQILDSQGVRKDTSRVKAIVDMTEPKDIGELRRFLGLVNHLMKFSPNLAEKTKPLRDLLKKENAWVWGPAQQEAFKRLKTEMWLWRLYSLCMTQKRKLFPQMQAVLDLAQSLCKSNHLSNGEVERAVQTMKMIMNKSSDEHLALLTYRDTPLHNGYSPAQLSMDRNLCTRILCHPDELLPQTPDYDQVKKKEREYRTKMKSYYDHRHRVVEGEELSPGDRVWIPDMKVEGTVIKPHERPRSVVI